jgi:RNA polymerase sigma-70 factor (ECF subfamily)
MKAGHTALLITCNRQMAEDVVQDAFLQVYRKIAQFDDDRPFSPWLLKIVINFAKKALRRQRKHLSFERSEDENPIAEWLIDPKKGPETLSESAELSEQVWQAIERLSPDQREAVVLRYFLGSKEREMVETLNRPLTTVKWWLYAARRRLRELLRPVAKHELEKEEASHE